MTMDNDTIPLRERLDFLRLDRAALNELAALQPMLDRQLPAALAVFYERLDSVPEMASFFSGKSQMDRAMGKQVIHWQSIASGRFDGDYLESSKRIGERHARIGLEPRWYLGGYALILEQLLTAVITETLAVPEPPRRLFGRATAPVDAEGLARKLSALVKAVLIDMDLAVTVYFDRLTEAAAERDRLASERIRRAVTLTGKTLKSLADGDLTARIVAEFDAEFEEIKHDTNAVADRLEAIVRQLRSTSGSLKTATGEILAGANDLSDRTTKQAATIEETSAAMEQLMGTVAANVASAKAATDSARAVSDAADAGTTVMAEANDAMERITGSSEKIAKIIGLIDDIAFQTNLLALNASVEAARAGEAGKGFAVVAVEVRRLAQSAAAASADIKALIEQSGADVRDGTALVAAATAKLAAIHASVRENQTLMEGIAAASAAQAEGIGEITVAVRQMDEMTQHNAALVEELNGAIEQTEQQAAELDMVVDQFTVSDGDEVLRRVLRGRGGGHEHRAPGTPPPSSARSLTLPSFACLPHQGGGWHPVYGRI
ncbi:MAG: globin-coupled sensor protein [Hyphomicrobiales bacterium]|nr:MAG: globin-coupled sensor protein [Hyphomicrobiales bacterium]